MESIGLKVKKRMILEIDNKGVIGLANNWSVGGRTTSISASHPNCNGESTGIVVKESELEVHIGKKKKLEQVNWICITNVVKKGQLKMVRDNNIPKLWYCQKCPIEQETKSRSSIIT